MRHVLWREVYQGAQGACGGRYMCGGSCVGEVYVWVLWGEVYLEGDMCVCAMERKVCVERSARVYTRCVWREMHVWREGYVCLDQSLGTEPDSPTLCELGRVAKTD